MNKEAYNGFLKDSCTSYHINNLCRVLLDCYCWFVKCSALSLFVHEIAHRVYAIKMFFFLPGVPLLSELEIHRSKSSPALNEYVVFCLTKRSRMFDLEAVR